MPVRYRITSSDGRTVHIEAVDWMMAMVRAAERLQTPVSGFSCEIRENGVVSVTDHESGAAWEITPVDHTGTPLAAERRVSPSNVKRSDPSRPHSYPTPPRKPLWSPDAKPRRGPEPAPRSHHPPPNLAERLFELSHRVAACRDVDEAARVTLNIVMALVPGEAGSVLRGGADEALLFIAATGPAGAALLGRSLPRGEGIAGAAALSGVTIEVQDVAADPRHLPDIDRETGFVTRSILCVPIRSETGFLGVIEVLNAPLGQGFLPWHVDVVESMTEALARVMAAGGQTAS